MRQRCIEPGRWIIEGRRVSAFYQGRSRNVLGWNVERLAGDPELPAHGFGTLGEAREWIAQAEAVPSLLPVPDPDCRVCYGTGRVPDGRNPSVRCPACPGQE